MSRFLCTNRSYELLEPYEGKLSRTVLRGERGSNVPALPDNIEDHHYLVEVSENVESHYYDCINYALFGLIRMTEREGAQR